MKSCVTAIGLFAIISMLVAKSINPQVSGRQFSFGRHTSGNVLVNVNNLGITGGGNSDGFIYPAVNGRNYLYTSGLWIGAKKLRRNAAGELLYWVAQNPSQDSSMTVPMSSPYWHEGMRPVVDTLTTLCFDGDADVNELLPAYNSFEVELPQFSENNILDKLLWSVQGNPGHRPFSYPDPQNSYCFTQPEGTDAANTASQSYYSPLYDFSPFGTAGQRDWGQGRSSNNHVPLGIAIEQTSYSWNAIGYEKMIIVKNIIYNTTADTLYDVCVGQFADADCGAVEDTTGAMGDVSGFCPGAGNNFAYSRDFDGDGGATPGYIASKLIIPGHTTAPAVWTWRVGHGPTDAYPQSFYTYIPPNEKYWLMTGNVWNTTTYYTRMDGSETDFESSTPEDTRFLNAWHGVLPTAANPNPAGRLNLASGGQITIYSAMFCDDNLPQLKQQSARIEAFISNNLNTSSFTGLQCIPYLYNQTQTAAGTFSLSWQSYSHPVRFEVLSRRATAPENQWNIIQLPGTARSYSLSNLQDLTHYKVKVKAVYGSTGGEQSYDSQIAEIYVNDTNDTQDPVLPEPALTVSPNPFTASVNISCQVKQGNATKLEVYNIRGERVRTLLPVSSKDGKCNWEWNGRNSSNQRCAAGVYLMRVSGKQATSRKVLLSR